MLFHPCPASIKECCKDNQGPKLVQMESFIADQEGKRSALAELTRHGQVLENEYTLEWKKSNIFPVFQVEK